MLGNMSPHVMIRTDSSREDKISSSVETARSKVFFHELVVVEIEENTPDNSMTHSVRRYDPNTPLRKMELKGVLRKSKQSSSNRFQMVDKAPT